MDSRDRVPDPFSHLRFALETMPGSRKYVFTPATRAEILSKLYDSFWGQYAHLFLPNSNPSLPLHKTLSEVQASLGFSGAGKPNPVIPGRPCGHILKKGESCFRCKDCSQDDSCVLCSRCFHATDHSGHNVSFFIAQQSGGCCDCGDEEAWRTPIQCPYHPPLPPPEGSAEGSSASTIKPASKPLPDNIPPVKNYPYRVPLPSEILREGMNRTVGYALDFVLDTLDYSPDEPSVPENEADLRIQVSADPMSKDQYCIVIWNDDKHSFEEVIKLLCDLTNRTREEASEVIHRLDETGREIIETNSSPTRLLEIAQTIHQIDLGVTVRRAYDTFREQISAVIIEWLLDLTKSRLGTDTLILREVISEELLSPRRRELRTATKTGIHSLPEVPNLTRLDTLFLYHTRLWKKPRLSLKEIYTAALTLSRDHKLAVAGHFANVYHRVIDAYLLVDREAETSIKYFALQLFTVPSVAAHIVRNHRLVSRLLAIITAFFTNQIDGKHITYPPILSADIDVDTFPFKSKRFMPVFSDLRYLCHNEPVQSMIARNREFIKQLAKTCQLFMCINPNKRAVTNHVEYETDAWISVFNVTLSLSRVIKVYGEAFAKATTADLINAISSVVHHILLVCTLSEDRLDRTKFMPIAFHDISFGGTVYHIIDFDVLEGWVSFHHSLHWLLAELFKHVELLSIEALVGLGMSGVQEILLRHASQQAILTIVDFPLRVLVMIAQIRVGLWVRNGFAIRGQLLHYRDFMLRELCYDQDLFILQVALTILDPNTVIVTILDRFGLLGYFSGSVIHSTYEGTQLSGMVEEVLYVLITILSENANASRMPVDGQARREIIHALALGPCSFTDLVKRVSERLVEDPSFERVLKEVTNFKVPESITETGVYELKDEAFDEVNPFFYHYTRNKREEVETILLNRLRKKTGVDDPVILPKPTKITTGPFIIIPACFESDVLTQIIFYALHNILVQTDKDGTVPPSGEAIVDQVLHLVMLGLVERKTVFSNLAVVKSFEEEKMVIDLLCTLESHEKFKPYKARVGWILDQMAEEVPAEVSIRRHGVASGSADSAADALTAKKKAAKARQEAIMRQMKAQQASFAINYDDLAEEEDEDMDVKEDEPVSFGTCIVCQEDLTTARSFGTLGMVQPSRFLRRQPDGSNVHLNEALQTPKSMDRPEGGLTISTFPPANAEAIDAKAAAANPNLQNFEAFPSQHTRFGLHASVCSHMMHLDCFHVYSVGIRARHRNQATRNHPENIARKEYICPLCKSLGNVILPVALPPTTTLSTVPFPDWIRAAGIGILKSKPDAHLESLQIRNGTGEFVFWSAQDSSYSTLMRTAERWPGENVADTAKMIDTLMVVSKAISQQTRHLRERHEPEPGERGAGMYLPEELVGYTIGVLEVAQRGVDTGKGIVADNISEPQLRMVRSLLTCLSRLASLHFKNRPDEGKDAIRQAIVKRLLPEWSRSSLTSFSYPLLLRDSFTVLVETACIAPDMLRHVLILTYYASLARTVVGLVFVLNKVRSYNTTQIPRRQHEDLFGDVRMFFMSVVRHSPVFEHTATLAFETFGDARIEQLLYSCTLVFLRKAVILCRAILPAEFSTPTFDSPEPNEYRRLLLTLGIPPLSDLPYQDTLQNALSGWCAHYGHSHGASPLNISVSLDLPSIYRLARLPLILDNLFSSGEGSPDRLMCQRCTTVSGDAAICLICGTVCCVQSDCCMDIEHTERKGECNLHSRECGGAIGAYFLVKRCSILYLYGGNGTFAQSPYLDAHGEVDVGMRRGRRQYLHQARWDDIRKIWLNHGFATLIARKLESTMDSGGWETL